MVKEKTVSCISTPDDDFTVKIHKYSKGYEIVLNTYISHNRRVSSIVLNKKDALAIANFIKQSIHEEKRW